MESFEEINAYLIRKLEADEYYASQLTRILECSKSLIDYEFLGFVDTYYHLSHIIPKGRVVYDMGCASAVQSWFFRNHKKYIGVDVDLDKDEVLTTPNSVFYSCTISEFISNNSIDNPSFAICNYVPPWGDDNIRIVKEAFEHVYLFYPEEGDDKEVFTITTEIKRDE